MGIIEDWGISIDDLNAVLSERPSLRGNLLGFLAEYKLQRTTFQDARIHGLKRFDDHDRTRPADFAFSYQGAPITVEVKSLQTGSVRKTQTGYLGKAQCDASDKRPVLLPNGDTIATTCLLVGKFDLLAINLFEFGQQWRFAFVRNQDLPRSIHKAYTPSQREHLLATGIPVTWPLQAPFRDEPFALLDAIAQEKHAAKRRRQPAPPMAIDYPTMPCVVEGCPGIMIYTPDAVPIDSTGDGRPEQPAPAWVCERDPRHINYDPPVAGQLLS